MLVRPRQTIRIGGIQRSDPLRGLQVLAISREICESIDDCFGVIVVASMAVVSRPDELSVL